MLMFSLTPPAPLQIKAAKGGGGKGMRVVNKEEDLIPLFNAASSEALAAFGDGGCFVERYVRNGKSLIVLIVLSLCSNTHNVLRSSQARRSTGNRRWKW